jgi:hypothetical protein
MTPHRFIIIVTALSLSSFGCTDEQWEDLLNAIHQPGSTDDPGVCYYNDDVYNVGETFDAADGCNTCGCNEDGLVSCTEMYCYKGCEWDGAFYNVGDTIGDSDGCNYCYCEEDGNVWCTDMDCVDGCYDEAGTFHGIGESFQQSCNSCYCMDDGTIECTLMACEPGCYVDNSYYLVGETFMQGCRTCVCQEDGTTACDMMYCPD